MADDGSVKAGTRRSLAPQKKAFSSVRRRSVIKSAMCSAPDVTLRLHLRPTVPRSIHENLIATERSNTHSRHAVFIGQTRRSIRFKVVISRGHSSVFSASHLCVRGCELREGLTRMPAISAPARPPARRFCSRPRHRFQLRRIRICERQFNRPSPHRPPLDQRSQPHHPTAAEHRASNQAPPSTRPVLASLCRRSVGVDHE